MEPDPRHESSVDSSVPLTVSAANSTEMEVDSNPTGDAFEAANGVKRNYDDETFQGSADDLRRFPLRKRLKTSTVGSGFDAAIAAPAPSFAGSAEAPHTPVVKQSGISLLCSDEVFQPEEEQRFGNFVPGYYVKQEAYHTTTENIKLKHASRFDGRDSGPRSPHTALQNTTPYIRSPSSYSTSTLPNTTELAPAQNYYEQHNNLPNPSALPRKRKPSSSSSSSAKKPKRASSKKSHSTSAVEPRLCICKQPYNENDPRFMIGCDTCHGWFHGECVNITQKAAIKLAHYECPECAEERRAREAAAANRRRGKSSKRNLVKCYNRLCALPARPGSKYCSDECGIRVAREKIARQRALAKSQEEAALAEALRQRWRETQTTSPPVAKSASNESTEPISTTAAAAPAPQPQAETPNTELTTADIEDFKQLDELDLERQKIESLLADLEIQEQKLSEITAFAATLTAPEDKEASATATSAMTPTPMTVDNEAASDTATPMEGVTSSAAASATSGAYHLDLDCISCGQPISAKSYARHIEACFMRKEAQSFTSAHRLPAENAQGFEYCNYYDTRQGTYCARLAAACPLHLRKAAPQPPPGVDKATLLCGCPSKDFASGYCERLKKNCAKHLGWQTIAQTALAMEKIRYTYQLGQLKHNVGIIHSRIARRRKVDSKNENVTVVEYPD